MRPFKYLGDKLNKRRQKFGMTRMQLADYAGLTRSTVDRILAGHKSIKIHNLRKVCTVLGLNITLKFTNR